MKDWSNCKRILLVRLDNMGDVIMNNPAFAQLKLNLPHARITLLTSSVASAIVPYLGTIDETIVFDSPWMKNSTKTEAPSSVHNIINILKQKKFDACILFNVYSQNILPAAFLCYLAEIPIRAAYCRENPYHLLTHWIPDPEPLQIIHHQIDRDRLLLKHLGFREQEFSGSYLISTSNDTLEISLINEYVLLNFDVSEEKRQIPLEMAIKILVKLQEDILPVALIGQKNSAYFDALRRYIDENSCIDLVGKTSLEELLVLTQNAKAVISVNTSVVHIACAFNTPVLALYADTNPQHLPWSAKSNYYVFPIPPSQKSKNEIIKYVDRTFKLESTELDIDKIWDMYQALLWNI